MLDDPMWKDPVFLMGVGAFVFVMLAAVFTYIKERIKKHRSGKEQECQQRE